MDRDRAVIRTSRSVDADAARRVSPGDRIHQLLGSLAGDKRRLAAFGAAPAAFLRQHQIDARDPQARMAIEAVESLLAAGRHADPSGEANAHGSVVVASSPIHGDGLFTHEEMGCGTVVCDVGVGGQVSHTASKVNQSGSPNTEMVQRDGRLVVQTVNAVKPGDELVASYPLVGGGVKSQLPPPRSG